MSAAVALLEGTEEGLSEDDLRIATAIIYTRFRGLFSSITTDYTKDGLASLVVWEAGKDGPLFRISRWRGKCVVIDDSTRKFLEADSLEAVLEAARALYPPVSAF